MLATLFMALGTGMLLLLKRSFTTDVWYGLMFPLAIPISMIFSGFAPLSLLKFTHWVAKREKPERLRIYSILLPLAVLFGFMTLPYNWWGMTKPASQNLHTRIFSNGLLLTVNLVAVIQVLIFVSQELREETNDIKKVSLQTLLAGLIASLGFFLFYTLDGLNPIPYSVYMNFAFLSGGLASLLLFLGTVMPEWYVSWIRKTRSGDT